MATKESTIVQRWQDLIDRKRSLENTIAHFRELQAQITFDFGWPIFTRDTQIVKYWARSGNNTCYYAYLKVRSSQDIFFVRRRVGRHSNGDWIYEDGLGKSKHLGHPGSLRHLSAVQNQILSMQWHIYQDQIDNLESLFPRLDEQIYQLQEAIAKFPPSENTPRPYDAVLGGEEGKKLRRDRYGF